jgi:5-keto 4-deoxyuronate isomerase
MSAEEFRQVIDVDLNAPFIVSKAVIPGMIKKGHGKIINICSMMSELGRETVSAYAAAKGGLKMLTRNIASEYGMQYNIQCNGIGPGYIATPQTAPLRTAGRQPHPLINSSFQDPGGRWGTTDDLMGPAVFLASDASNFVNGHVLYVDGGIAYIGKQPTSAKQPLTEYPVGRFSGLYLSMGTKAVSFAAKDPADPPKFYMCSTPAHKPCPTTLIPYEKAIHRKIGSAETSNARTINQYIHPDVLETCQLSMGMTALEPGSVWNTMPAHTHERRMEVYMYFAVPENNVVFHLMGEGTETRHVVMQNEQAVINPSWSIHSGCGTSNYTFIWAMAGENRAYDDMDVLPTTSLR